MVYETGGSGAVSAVPLFLRLAFLFSPTTKAAAMAAQHEVAARLGHEVAEKQPTGAEKNRGRQSQGDQARADVWCMLFHEKSATSPPRPPNRVSPRVKTAKESEPANA